MRLAVCLVLAGTLLTSQLAQAQPYRFAPEVRRAMLLYDRGDYAGALAVIEKALAKDPRDAVALATRGNILIEIGDYERAKSDHDEVLRLAPRSGGALANACWVRALANVELDLALTYCNQALALAGDKSPGTYDTRGFLYLRRREFALAKADYDAAFKGMRFASALYGRGLAALRLGEDAQGRADMAAAAKRDSTIAETYAKRGETP